MSRTIIIRGSPASGKTCAAKALAAKLSGKVAFVSADEFRWVMTVHENRDEQDYVLSWSNYLRVLESYLEAGYSVVTEDVFIQKHNDRSTDVRAVIALAERFGPVTCCFLSAPWDVVRCRNAARAMVLPEEELRELYDYSLPCEKDCVVDAQQPTKEIVRQMLEEL